MSHFSLTASNWIGIGIGVALSYGASLIGRMFKTLAQARQAHVMGKTVRGSGPGSTLLPGEIITAIQKAPVIQQPHAARVYHGMNVRWRVTFESAFTSGLTTMRLMCQDRGNFPWVICDVRKGKYPQLAGMLKHTPFWLSGHINRIEADEIYLRGVSLSFED